LIVESLETAEELVVATKKHKEGEGVVRHLQQQERTTGSPAAGKLSVTFYGR